MSLVSAMGRAMVNGTLVISLVGNGLFAVSETFNSLVADAIGKSPSSIHFEADNKKLRKHIAKIEAANKKVNAELLALQQSTQVKMGKVHGISNNIISRTIKGVTMNTSSAFLEAIPFIGAGVIAAEAGATLWMACADVNDAMAIQSIATDKAVIERPCSLDMFN